MKLFKNTALAFCTCALAATGVAHAQEAAEVYQPEPVGVGLTVGGGVTGFTDSASDDAVDIGGLWEVRAILGAGAPLSVEAAYIGTAQKLSAPQDSTLLSNGLEGIVRINLGGAMSQPYVFGGMGWRHYTVEFSGRALGLSTDDDVMTIPAGAGISFISGNFLFDMRGTYSWAINDELLERTGEFQEEASLNSWSATARLGVVF